jgi:hypothetical protein
MKPSRIVLVVILLAAILCCWQSAVSLRQARDYTFVSFSVPHRVVSVSPRRDQIVGILADPKFREVLHALEQRSGVERLAEPEVVTTHGSVAVNRMYYDERFTLTVTNR